MKMEYSKLKEKTRRNIVNARYRVSIFQEAKKLELGINKKGLNLAQEDLDYSETIKHILYTIPNKLERWLELLQTDGCNSKSMVANDIQYLLKEINESEKN